MRRGLAGAIAAHLLLLPLAAAAQQAPATRPAQPREGQQAPPSPQAAQEASPQVPELPVSLSRIRKGLRALPVTRSAGIRYDFHVDVIGKNPKVDFFKNFDLSPGGFVRYGGMTHQEFLDVTRPQEFRAPSGNILGLAALAIQQITKKK